MSEGITPIFRQE